MLNLLFNSARSGKKEGEEEELTIEKIEENFTEQLVNANVEVTASDMVKQLSEVSPHALEATLGKKEAAAVLKDKNNVKEQSAEKPKKDKNKKNKKEKKIMSSLDNIKSVVSHEEDDLEHFQSFAPAESVDNLSERSMKMEAEIQTLQDQVERLTNLVMKQEKDISLLLTKNTSLAKEVSMHNASIQILQASAKGIASPALTVTTPLPSFLSTAPVLPPQQGDSNNQVLDESHQGSKPKVFAKKKLY